MTNQQQQRALRWFFKHFQERVGAKAVKLIDGVDNGDAPSPLRGGRAEEADGAPDVFHGNLLTQNALVIWGAFQNQQIALGARRHPAGDRMCRFDRERSRALHFGRPRV